MNELVRKKVNYGISILRVILSLMVIFDHFYYKITYTNILYYHIPTFFLLSFYYTYNTLSSFNITKIKSRFERLLIPYIYWIIISWLIFNIDFYIFKDNCPHSIFVFLQNFLCGRIFIPALWFQNCLIFVTLVIVIIIFLFKTKYILIFQLLIFFSYYLQYSGINFRFFVKNYDDIYLYTYARIV